MKITKKIVLTLFAVLLSAVPVFAAEEELEKKKDLLLDPVTVTAQKRKEDLKDVPASVSVLSEEAIKDAFIQSTQDIQQYVPNLTTGSMGGRGYFSRVSIRGITNMSFGDPGVTLYVDDVPYSDIYIFSLPLFDTERIEVLKGPQGALYGKNTEGGVINVITKQATNKKEAQLGFEAGDYEHYRVYGSANVPLVDDKLYLRVAALAEGKDGYVDDVTTDNTLGGEETKSFRGSLVCTPSDRWDIAANLSLTLMDDDGLALVPFDTSRYEAATGLKGLDDFESGPDYTGSSTSEFFHASLKVRYMADTFDVLSVSSLRTNENDMTMDGDFTPSKLYIGFNTFDMTTFTQEVRIMSKPEQTAFKWLVGLYYSDETKDTTTGYALDKDYADYMGVPVGVKDLIEATLDAQDAALFGQSTLRFFDETLGITAGLRYDVAYRSMDRSHSFAGQPSAPDIDQDKTFNQILPKVALDYRITQDVTAYGSYAMGYKAGGYSYGVDNPDLVLFDPEKSNSFEIGVKSQFPDLGLRLNLAAFYTKVDDYQDRVQHDAMTVIQANVATMTSRGVEIEAMYEITRDWSLTAAFGYTHAEYGDYPDAQSNANYKGNKVALMPEYDLNAGLQYRSPLGFLGRLEMRQVGASYMDRANTYEQDPYLLTNVKIGYETEHWDVYLSVQNLTNEQYFLDGYEDTSVGWLGAVGAPRTIGLSGSIRF